MRVRNSVMVLLGVAVMVLPFLGFPGWMKTGFFMALGLVIAVISYFSGLAHRSEDMNHSTESTTKLQQDIHNSMAEKGNDHPRA